MCETALSARSDIEDKGLVRSFSYINGKWCAAQNVAAIKVTDPATGALIGDVASLSAEESSAAVDAAQANGTQQAENAGPDTPGADASLWSRVWDGVSDAGGAASDAVREAVPDMDAVQVRGGEILQSSLTLIAIYVFRLLVLPFVLLWGGLLLARRVLAA